MHTKDAYNSWAKTYDLVVNKTRDLEERAIRAVLADTQFESTVEIGCGTGKNTSWLAEKSRRLLAVDFSEEMLQIAKEKNNSEKVSFLQADITRQWNFGKADLITCSLVLEHINDIVFVFEQAAALLNKNGKFYICELHPYKQLMGGRARFEKDGDLLQLQYFIHHLSDFFSAAQQQHLICDGLQEWFDDDDRSQNPRLVSYLFCKG